MSETKKKKPQSDKDRFTDWDLSNAKVVRIQRPTKKSLKPRIPRKRR